MALMSMVKFRMFRKLLKNPKALFGVGVLVAFFLTAAFAPHLAPGDPEKQALSKPAVSILVRWAAATGSGSRVM